MPLILALLSCAEPPPPLVYVSEAEGRPVAVRGGRPIADLPGATWPAAPDPRGEGWLLVAAVEGPAGHRERLWWVADGAPVPLTPEAEVVRNPAWSADGEWIVYESSAASFRDLYRVRRTGGSPERLTDAPHGSFEPTVAPDGRVAFGTSRDGNAEIWTMALDGSAPRRLTDHPTDDVDPAWSPDGSTLAWRSARDGWPRVWLSAPDGSGARPLRPAPATPAIDLDHVWSPDGRRLAVVVQSGPQDIGIEVVDAQTGTTIGRLDGPGVDEHPAFSRDGRRLAFTSSRAGQPDVWSAAPDGSEPRQETSTPAAEWLPRFP